MVEKLKEIIEKYPHSLQDRQKLRALFMDYFPDKKKECNILLMVFDEEIVAELKNINTLDNIGLNRYIKIIINGYGVADDYAKEAITTWALSMNVHLNTNDDIETSKTLSVHTAEVIWQDVSDCNDYEYVNIPNGLKITKFVGFDEPIITVPNMIYGKKVLEIGNYAFSGCVSITKIVLSDGLLVLGNGVFKGCNSLKEVILPNTLEQIGWDDLTGCPKDWRGQVDVEGAFASTQIEEIIIPNSVHTIEKNSFSNCSELKKVLLPSKLKVIKESTFNNCSIENIDFPNTIEKIEKFAFGGCDKLLDIKLPNGLYTIENYAFFMSVGIGYSLRNIYIPKTVQCIGSGSEDDKTFSDKYYRSKLVIYCEAGSYAMQYARKLGIKCVKA